MYAFLDESGDHNLNFAKGDNHYNVFVLGTVLIAKEEYVALDKEFDVYELSFENALNRVLYYGTGNEIEIYSECRDDSLDKRLEGEFAKYSIAGTRFHKGEEIKRRIKRFECKPKKENITGLQFADLLVSPVGRHFLGIRPKPPGNEITYEIVRKKLAGTDKLCLTVLP